MSKRRQIIVFILIFAVIAAGMTFEFSKRLIASVAITAAEHDPEMVFSGGISRFPDAGTYAWAVFILGLIVTGSMAFLVLRSGWRKEKLFLVMAIPLGMIYIFMMVPLAIPDEQVHYQTAYQLSSILCFRPGMGIAEHFDYNGLGGHYNLTSGYDRVMRDLLAPLNSGEEMPLRFHYNLTYPVMYLPQAIGLALGRLLGGNFVRIFLTGRIFNLLFYALCVYWAIRLTPKYKTLFMMTGLMPMAIHQAASFSYDAFNIGGALLLFALVFRSALGKGRIIFREFALIILVGVLLIPAKPTNYPLLLVYLLIPAERFQSKKQKCLWLIAAWVLTLAIVLLIQIGGITSAASSTETNWEGKQNYTIAYALAHPLETAKIYLNTIRLYGRELFYQIIGSVMAGQTMPMPGKYVKVYLLLLLLCILHQGNDNKVIPWRDRAVCFGSVALSVLLTMTTMFLAWTSIDKETIQGLQGRYFIPCFPLALICLDNDIIRIHRDVDRFVMITGLVMQMGMIIEILCKTMLI